jgi:hypothetical protein
VTEWNSPMDLIYLALGLAVFGLLFWLTAAIDRI